MTRALTPDLHAANQPARSREVRPTGTRGPDDDPGPVEFPVHRSVTAHVLDGMDGALRVVTMLRSRRYRVRDLSVDVREGVVQSQIRCTVVLTASEADLLLERLRRLPVVVSAENA